MVASRRCLSGGRSYESSVLASGRPIVIEQRRRMSDRTVAHAMFFTTRGTKAVSSALPREWLNEHAQWMSFIPGWLSCKIISSKFKKVIQHLWTLDKNTNLIGSKLDCLHGLEGQFERSLGIAFVFHVACHCEQLGIGHDPSCSLKA